MISLRLVFEKETSLRYLMDHMGFVDGIVGFETTDSVILRSGEDQKVIIGVFLEDGYTIDEVLPDLKDIKGLIGSELIHS